MPLRRALPLPLPHLLPLPHQLPLRAAGQIEAVVADLATRTGVEGRPISLETPLLHMSKADIVRAGHRLDVDYADTLSCYDPQVQGDDALACGHCDSCQLRREGFVQAGLVDPTRYA